MTGDVMRPATYKEAIEICRDGLDAHADVRFPHVMLESLAADLLDRIGYRGLLQERDELREARDRWIKLFNRLDAAVAHHRKDKITPVGDPFAEPDGKYFSDDGDQALHAAHDRILKSSASQEEE